MPRTAITSYRRHGSQKWDQLFGQHVPIQDQLVEFRRLRALEEHEEFAEAEYWERDGGCRAFTKFNDPRAAKKAAAEKAAAEKAAAEKAAAEKAAAEKAAAEKAAAEKAAAEKAAAEKAAAEKSAAEAASTVSSEADTPSTPEAPAELTGEDAPPTAAEPQSPAAPQPSPAETKAKAKAKKARS